jgi:hypothetical protein
MAAQEYRDAYFECPEDLAGYQNGELTEFVADLNDKLKTRISAEAGPDTVVALLGVGPLFGLARVSSVVEGIKEAVQGSSAGVLPWRAPPREPHLPPARRTRRLELPGRPAAGQRLTQRPPNNPEQGPPC